MKKLLLLLLLCCLLLTGCGQTYDGPTVEAQLLTAQDSYHWYGDQVDHIRYEYAYDTYGNEARVRYYLNEELVSDTRKSYDAQGRQTEAISLYYGAEDITEVVDEAGQTTLVHTKSSLLPQYTRAVFSYDGLGRVQTVVQRNFWGMYRSQNSYIYDELGGCTVHYAAEDKRVLHSNYQRTETDELGRTVCQVQNDREYRYVYGDSQQWVRFERWEQGVLESVTLRELDEAGRPLRETDYDGQGKETTSGRWEYEGRKGTFYQNGTLREVVFYDEQGNVISRERSNGQGEVTYLETYTYTWLRIPAEEDVP